MVGTFLGLILFPREIFEEVIKQKKYTYFLFFTILSGVAIGFDRTIGSNLGNSIDLFQVIGLIIALGVLFSPIYIGVFSFVIGVGLSIFKMKIEKKMLRTLVAYCQMPTILHLLLFVPVQIFLVRSELFCAQTPTIDSTPHLALLMLIDSIVALLCNIWMLILVIKAVKEATDLSTGKAFISVLFIPGIILLGVFFINTFAW